MGFPEDGSLSIGGSVYVESANGLGKFFQGEVGERQQSEVDEVSGRSGIDEGRGFDDLSYY